MNAGQMEMDPTKRFSNRVEYYVRYRPRYPAVLLAFLKEALGLTADTVIADIGSGTGFLSELFLQNGNAVFGVEPNAEMRTAAEEMLRDYPNFTSVAGTAEATTLPDHCVDMITAGQAFHWFDAERAKAEFRRILRPGGFVALVWNERRTSASPFMRAYEDLLRSSSIDYENVKHQNVDDEALRRFFAPSGFQVRAFENRQQFDFDGLKGRLLSSSYMPLPGHPAYEELIAALRRLFAEYEAAGQVTFAYETQLYYGRL